MEGGIIYPYFRSQNTNADTYHVLPIQSNLRQSLKISTFKISRASNIKQPIWHIHTVHMNRTEIIQPLRFTGQYGWGAIGVNLIGNWLVSAAAQPTTQMFHARQKVIVTKTRERKRLIGENTAAWQTYDMTMIDVSKSTHSGRRSTGRRACCME